MNIIKWAQTLPMFDPSYLDTLETIGIICTDENDAVWLFEILDRFGFQWASGDKLTFDDTKWEEYKEKTCYYINYDGPSMEVLFGTPEPDAYKYYCAKAVNGLSHDLSIDIMDMV